MSDDSRHQHRPPMAKIDSFGVVDEHEPTTSVDASTNNSRKIDYEAMERAKREQRLSLNRDSARARRRRQKIKMDNLELLAVRLEEENRELEATNEAMARRAAELELELSEIYRLLSTNDKMISMLSPSLFQRNSRHFSLRRQPLHSAYILDSGIASLSGTGGAGILQRQHRGNAGFSTAGLSKAAAAATARDLVGSQQQRQATNHWLQHLLFPLQNGHPWQAATAAASVSFPSRKSNVVLNRLSEVRVPIQSNNHNNASSSSNGGYYQQLFHNDIGRIPFLSSSQLQRGGVRGGQEDFFVPMSVVGVDGDEDGKDNRSSGAKKKKKSKISYEE